jgi:hypothetical protein
MELPFWYTAGHLILCAIDTKQLQYTLKKFMLLLFLIFNFLLSGPINIRLE